MKFETEQFVSIPGYKKSIENLLDLYTGGGIATGSLNPVEIYKWFNIAHFHLTLRNNIKEIYITRLAVFIEFWA